MKKYFLLTLMLSLFTMAFPSKGLAVPLDKQHSNLARSAGDVIGAINSYRQQNGLPALTPNSLLSSLAQSQSDYQATLNTVTHSGPGGTTPQERAAAAGYGGGSYFYLSEIIYGGYNQTTQNALSWWQNSSLHNSIMLDSKYTEIGAGVASNGDQVYFTAVLGGPSGTTSGGGDDPGGSGNNDDTPPPQSAPVVMPIQKATPMADGSIIHTVQTGQTLWTIAAVYEIELSTLYELNELNQYSFVFPGDQIMIRPPGLEEDVEVTKTPTQEKPGENFAPVLGTPYSSLDETSTPNTPRNTPIPTPTTAPPQPTQEAEGLFAGESTARYLVIGSFVVLLSVLVGSMFLQKPPSRPDSDPTDR